MRNGSHSALIEDYLCTDKTGPSHREWLSSEAKKDSYFVEGRNQSRWVTQTPVLSNSESIASTVLGTTDGTEKTELARKLLALRARIVESGQPLLTWEEIHEEITARRGEAK